MAHAGHAHPVLHPPGDGHQRDTDRDELPPPRERLDGRLHAAEPGERLERAGRPQPGEHRAGSPARAGLEGDPVQVQDLHGGREQQQHDERRRRQGQADGQVVAGAAAVAAGRGS